MFGRGWGGRCFVAKVSRGRVRSQSFYRVVADFFSEQRALGARDRHVLADGVFALLRKLPLWRHLASSANGGRGEIERRLALLVWQGNAGVLNAALDERERPRPG